MELSWARSITLFEFHNKISVSPKLNMQQRVRNMALPITFYTYRCCMLEYKLFFCLGLSLCRPQKSTLVNHFCCTCIPCTPLCQWEHWLLHGFCLAWSLLASYVMMGKGLMWSPWLLDNDNTPFPPKGSGILLLIFLHLRCNC